VASLQIEEGGDLKILTIADLHFANDNTSEDNNALLRLDALVEASDPDMIILLGDVIYTNYYMPEAMQAVVDKMDSYAVPWAYVFGNHDATGVLSPFVERSQSIANKEALTTVLEGSEYCLYDRGLTDIDGFGNYIVNIKSGDRIVETLFFLDSGEYIKEEDLQYDFVTEDDLMDTGIIYPSQINWYEQTVNKLTEYNGTVVPSLMFFHIPLPEYRTAYDLWNTGSEEAVLVSGELHDSIGKPHINTGLFDKIVELQSTKATFVGHDHANNFDIRYRGVDLCYNGGMKLIVYPAVSDEIVASMFGGRVITLNSDGSFTNEILSYNSIA
jgi:predicted MPP superfamily phosphohydrolase